MDVQILIGLFITLLPVFELRGGLPIVIEYVVRNELSIWPYFVLVLALNILVIFFAFFFLDFVHDFLMKVKWYRFGAERVLKRFQKKVGKVENRMNEFGYIALMFFVAVPLPGTGAWTGVLAAWVLRLDRRKSFFAIAAGVIIAGLLILIFSLGLFGNLN